MKKVNIKFTAILLILAIMLSGLVAFGGLNQEKAKADSLIGNGTSDTIYYFFDYYPTIGNTTLSMEYGSRYNIVYARHYGMTLDEFIDLFSNGYFTGFGDNCVVIIDIKTFKPEETKLSELFTHLKENEECITAFVTIFDKTDYSSITFDNIVDVYYKTDFSKLKDLIERMLYDLDHNDDNDGIVQNAIILIDGYLVGASEYDDIGRFDEICQKSKFLSLLLEELSKQFAASYNSYREILEHLTTYYKIKLIVHVGGDKYVDLYDRTEYSSGDLEELWAESVCSNPPDDNPSGIIPPDTPQPDDNSFDVCAFGFWRLDIDFYDFLLRIQTALNLPIYIIEADPIIWGNGGLTIIISSNISAEESELLELLRSATGG